MRKPDSTPRDERLRDCLVQLRAGRNVASQDLLALMTTDQIIGLAAAWVEEKQFSVNLSMAGEEPCDRFWQKRRREIYINAIEAALRELEDCDAGIDPHG